MKMIPGAENRLKVNKVRNLITSNGNNMQNISNVTCSSAHRSYSVLLFKFFLHFAHDERRVLLFLHSNTFEWITTAVFGHRVSNYNVHFKCLAKISNKQIAAATPNTHRVYIWFHFSSSLSLCVCIVFWWWKRVRAILKSQALVFSLSILIKILQSVKYCAFDIDILSNASVFIGVDGLQSVYSFN